MSHNSYIVGASYTPTKIFFDTLRFQVFCVITFFKTNITDASAEHEDCEIPPKIDHGTVKLSADENDDIVTALYSCKSGFKLQGNAEIYCDLDTDVWQSDPPTCHEGKFLLKTTKTFQAIMGFKKIFLETKNIKTRRFLLGFFSYLM